MGIDVSRAAKVIAAIVITAILLGEASVYLFNVNSYNAEASWDGDVLTYTVYSSGSDCYDVVAMNNARCVTELVIYSDENYLANLAHAREKTVVPYAEQSYYSDQMSKQLAIRGVKNTKILDSAGLKEYVESTWAASAGKGILVMGYSLPGSVYTGQNSDLLMEWISNGGRLYWAGSEIGKFYTSADGLHEVSDNQNLFLGKSDCTLVTDSVVVSEGFDEDGFYGALSLKSFQMNLAVDISGVSDSMAFGAYYGGYNSAVSVRFGSGSVTVVSGLCSLDEYNDIAQIIASGIDYDTVLVRADSGPIHGTVKGTVSVCDFVYIYVGGLNTVFGRYAHV